MEMIEAKNLVYEYIRRDEEGNVEGIIRAVDGVSMEVKRGDFVAILGHNGPFHRSTRKPCIPYHHRTGAVYEPNTHYETIGNQYSRGDYNSKEDRDSDSYSHFISCSDNHSY